MIIRKFQFTISRVVSVHVSSIVGDVHIVVVALVSVVFVFVVVVDIHMYIGLVIRV